MLPYFFREVMAFEINRYAEQVLWSSDTNKVSGYQWKDASVGEIITYFGILIFAMLSPQTGRRFWSTWNNPELHPWMANMSKGHLMQISAMLNFNNKEDIDGVHNDLLHKVQPLLEIIKRMLGRYGIPGSEFSFDEATMACFSRYDRGLISFNPKKQTTCYVVLWLSWLIRFRFTQQMRVKRMRRHQTIMRSSTTKKISWPLTCANCCMAQELLSTWTTTICLQQQQSNSENIVFFAVEQFVLWESVYQKVFYSHQQKPSSSHGAIHYAQ
jgi:hypothetical protein